MSNVRFALRVVCLFSVLSAIALHGCDARGARGGGFRSSFRSSSSSSYRSTSLSRSFRSSSLRRGTSPFTRSNWVMNAALIYGATRYMRSRRYYDRPDDSKYCWTWRCPSCRLWMLKSRTDCVYDSNCYLYQ